METNMPDFFVTSKITYDMGIFKVAMGEDVSRVITAETVEGDWVHKTEFQVFVVGRSSGELRIHEYPK